MKAIIFSILLLSVNSSVAQIMDGVVQLVTTLDTAISNTSSFNIRSNTKEGQELFIFTTKYSDSLFNAYIPSSNNIEKENYIFIPCISNHDSSWSVLYAGKDTIEILPREYKSPDLVFKPWEVFILQCDSVQRTDPTENPVVGYPNPDGPIIRSLDSMTNFKVFDVFEIDGHWWLRIYQGKEGEHVWGYHKDYEFEYEGKIYENRQGFYSGYIQWRNKEELMIIPKPNFKVEWY